MSLILEFLLLLGIFLPLYHAINALISYNKRITKGYPSYRPMSILVPCFNEEIIIKNTIEGMLRIDYDNYECIFINDGSSDNTFRILKRFLALKKIRRKPLHSLDSKKIEGIYQSRRHKNIFLLNKKNGGKSDALNAGINYSTNNCIITLDADSIIKRDVLPIVSSAFDDDSVVAASGIIQILQSFDLSNSKEKSYLGHNKLVNLQTIEYIKACYCYKSSLAKVNSLLVISGAFGIFRKEILLDVDGFNHVIGEDLDLTIRIQFKIRGTNKKIVYLPSAICYTEGPETIKDFIKQRKRWQKSFVECLFNHKNTIFNNTFSKTITFFFVIDALLMGIINSLIIFVFSFAIFYTVLSTSPQNFLIYFLIFVSLQLLNNIVSIIIASHYQIKYKGKSFFKLILTIILDLTIYRLLVLWTIIVGSFSYFSEKKVWDTVKRSGRNYNVLKKEDNY